MTSCIAFCFFVLFVFVGQIIYLYHSLSLSPSVDLRFISLIGQSKAYLYHSSYRKSTEGSTIGTLEFITLDQVRTTKVFM